MQKMQETWVQTLSWKDSLDEEMAIYSSILAWEIPQIEEPGRLQCMGLQSLSIHASGEVLTASKKKSP